MKCDKARTMLWALCEETLDRETADALNGHVRSCEACRQELAGVRQTLGALKSVGEIEPRADFQDRLCQRIDAWEARRQVTWLEAVTALVRRNTRLVAASAAAFVLALFGGLYMLHNAIAPGLMVSQQTAVSPASTSQGTGYEGIVPSAGAKQNFVMREIPYQSQMVTVTRTEGADTIYTRFPAREIAPPRGLVRDNYVDGPSVTPVSTSQPIY
ncbi:MAG TPA: zf-HC2 domain-containing protein [bacterium]|nr:zf-HC2 domain-containing protein [bacterium]